MQSPRVKKDRKPRVERRVGECCQWKAIVSVMIQRLETDAIRDTKDVLHQKRRHRLTGRYPQKVQAAEGKVFVEHVFVEQEARFHAEISSGESVRIRHVIFGTLP